MQLRLGLDSGSLAWPGTHNLLPLLKCTPVKVCTTFSCPDTFQPNTNTCSVFVNDVCCV
jgi:hypothetical protein